MRTEAFDFAPTPPHAPSSLSGSHRPAARAAAPSWPSPSRANAIHYKNRRHEPHDCGPSGSAQQLQIQLRFRLWFRLDPNTGRATRQRMRARTPRPCTTADLRSGKAQPPTPITPEDPTAPASTGAGRTPKSQPSALSRPTPPHPAAQAHTGTPAATGNTDTTPRCHLTFTSGCNV